MKYKLKTILMMSYTLTTLMICISVKMITVPVSCAAAVELEAMVQDTMENKKREIANNWKAGRKTILEPGWCE